MFSFFFSIATSCFRLYEWLRVVCRYYVRSPHFFYSDVLLASHYLFKNPHRISKAFLSKQGENPYQFGQTPLTTLDQIARAGQILSHDVVYELGCGTGRTCFWLSIFVNCKVVGVDYLPAFIHKAQRVQQKTQQLHLDFLEADMLTVDLSFATVVYLYGTCLNNETLTLLLSNFRHLRPGARVITVSYPLTDYCDGTLFQVTNQFRARFPWGKAWVFINKKRAC
jgi:SAM-dependent methyltransferase